MFRDIMQKATKVFNEKIAGNVNIETLMDRKQVKMTKTAEYEADDHANLTCWSYRFKFDNQGRKRSFLEATKNYPPQEWDKYIRWMDDISNLNPRGEPGAEEITVEAHCRVPKDLVGRVRYQFESFVVQLAVKG